MALGVIAGVRGRDVLECAQVAEGERCHHPEGLDPIQGGENAVNGAGPGLKQRSGASGHEQRTGHLSQL